MNRDRIFPGFGELNPIEEPNIGKFFDPRNTSATSVLKQTTLESFKKDSFENSGPLKGRGPDDHIREA